MIQAAYYNDINPYAALAEIERLDRAALENAAGSDNAEPGEHQEVLDAIQSHNSGEEE